MFFGRRPHRWLLKAQRVITLSSCVVDSRNPSDCHSQHPPRAPVPHHFSRLLQPIFVPTIFSTAIQSHWEYYCLCDSRFCQLVHVFILSYFFQSLDCHSTIRLFTFLFFRIFSKAWIATLLSFTLRRRLISFSHPPSFSIMAPRKQKLVTTSISIPSTSKLLHSSVIRTFTF